MTGNITFLSEIISNPTWQVVTTATVVVFGFLFYRMMKILKSIEATPHDIKDTYAELKQELDEQKKAADIREARVQSLYKSVYMILWGMVDDLHVNGKVKKHRDFRASKGNWSE